MKASTTISQDHLGFKSNPTILKSLGKNEEILLTCGVQKYNKFGIYQSRNFVLTNERVCNYKNDSLKREIKVT